MNVYLTGVGLWARGLESWLDMRTHLDSGSGPIEITEQLNKPTPAAIPPKERRRAGLTINLAVEVAHQACETAGVDKANIPSVFASAMGDTELTDYMCRKLATPERLLSPTKFHNSVHNAPSGYWTISTENRMPSTFVSAFDKTFAIGLFEAISLCQVHGRCLLVAYDIANKAPFNDISPIQETLGVALVLENEIDKDRQSHMAPVAELLLTIEPTVLPAAVRSPEQQRPILMDHLAELAAGNPMGSGLTLLATAHQTKKSDTTTIPNNWQGQIGSDTQANVRLSAVGNH